MTSLLGSIRSLLTGAAGAATERVPSASAAPKLLEQNFGTSQSGLLEAKINQLLVTSPHELGKIREERTIENVLPWMSECVQLIAHNLTSSTDRKLLTEAVAREVADGGRASKYSFLEAIRLESKGEFAPWTGLLETAASVYRVMMDGPQRAPRPGASIEERIQELAYNVWLQSAPLEQRHSFVETFNDLCAACSPSYLARVFAATLRGAMRAYACEPADPQVKTFFSAAPRMVSLAQGVCGIQADHHIFLFPEDLKDHVGRVLDKVLQARTLGLSDEMLCDLITLGCRNEYSSPAATAFLRRHAPWLDASILSEPLAALGALTLGAPSDSFLRVPRVDRVGAVSPSDSADYIRMVSYPMRDLVEGMFGIRLEALTLTEQFCLLDTLKKYSHKATTETAATLRTYGTPAARAFIVCEYSRSHADQLAGWIGASESTVVKERLAAFSEALDALWKFSGELDHHTKQIGATGVCKDIPRQLTEGFLRRLTDLFLAGMDEAVAGSTGKAPSHQDVLKALNAVTTLLTLLADGGQQKAFEFYQIDPDGRDSQPENLIYAITDKANGARFRLKMLFRPRESESGEARWNVELELPKDYPDSSLYAALLHTVRYAATGKQIYRSLLRCGLDRDTFGPEPRVSLDLGRGPFKGKTFETNGCVVGRILSAVSSDTGGHHNVYSFAPELAQSESFAQVVNFLRAYFTEPRHSGGLSDSLVRFAETA